MALETTYLRRIHVASPVQEAQAWEISQDASVPEPCRSTDLTRVPQVRVPERWRAELPHQQFVTVLPYQEAAQFREICRSASVVQRQDDNADVIGVYRKGIRPVWLTGIFQRDGKRIDGLLDFGGKHRRERGVPNVYFRVLYGHPDSIGFEWGGLYNALEEQFETNGFDRVMRRKMVRAWTPHLRPLADTMERLEESAFAVVFTGLNKHRGLLTELGIKRIPAVTNAVTNLLDTFWTDMPFQVGRAGWFVRKTEGI